LPVNAVTTPSQPLNSQPPNPASQNDLTPKNFVSLNEIPNKPTKGKWSRGKQIGVALGISGGLLTLGIGMGFGFGLYKSIK
jgi:hypothetical protein